MADRSSRFPARSFPRSKNSFARTLLRLDRLDERIVPTATDVMVTGAGASGGPHAKVFDATSGALQYEFSAYDQAFRGGVRVASADVTGDQVPDIITAPGPGGGPVIRVFDGASASASAKAITAPGEVAGLIGAGQDVALKGEVGPTIQAVLAAVK